MPNEDQRNGWRSELRSFFDEINREDERFGDYVEQVARFHADTALPALEEAGRELNLYGREYETGKDGGRVFIIVRAAGEKVEFQYAVVVEVKIEGITPYVHCWYEETPKDEAQSAQQSDDEQKQKREQSQAEDKNDGAKEQGQGREQKRGKEQGGEEDGQDEKKDGNEQSGEGKSSNEPKRTKTIEPLANWMEGRELQSIRREEIVNDFIAHYKEAVARLRAPMHAAQTNQQ